MFMFVPTCFTYMIDALSLLIPALHQEVAAELGFRKECKECNYLRARVVYSAMNIINERIRRNKPTSFQRTASE